MYRRLYPKRDERRSPIIFILDNSPEKIKGLSLPDNVTYIESTENSGFGKGHNTCLSLAEKMEPDAHLFINPDVQFQSEGVLALYDFLLNDKSIGIVTPAVYYPDGRFQYVCRNFPRPYELAVRLFSPVLPERLVRKVNEKHELHNLDYTQPQSVPMVNGCFFMADFNVLKEVGYFDERFFLYFEDVDLCRRIGDRYKLYFFPEVKITHKHGKGSSKNIRSL